MKTSFLVPRKKIVKRSQVRRLARRLHRAGKKIVFTNGTFDILHVGHVRYLWAAKQEGDILMVGVNTDRSVKTYKAPSRPVNPEADRAEVLASLACVDYVILFEEPTPRQLIRDIRPHLLVKGADWKLEKIEGAAEVRSWGGQVKRVRLVPGRSTTRIIHKIRESVRSN